MSIEIRQVTKFYGNQKALDNLSFVLRKGELVGFLGPNGAGKSTLMKIITGYLPADLGEVVISGKQVLIDNSEIKKMIGYLPENNPLYADLFIKEYLEIAAGFYRIPRVASRVKEIIMLTGLESEKNKKIGALSKGYRQRVGLAQALIHDPSVLILDEPTSGLDPNQLDEIRKLISDISREKTVLLSSHILQEIEALCGRVVIIAEGKLVADSTLSSLGEMQFRKYQLVYVEFDKPVTETALSALDGVVQVRPENKGWMISAGEIPDIRPVLFRYAVDNKRMILSMYEKQQNLEDIFRQLTRG